MPSQGLLWRLVARRLRRNVPADRVDPVLVDLAEDYTARRRQTGSLRAALWLLREGRSLEVAYRTMHDDRPAPRFRQWPEATWRDLRIAVRRLRQAPLFTVFAVASLALGLGGTTAAYSIVQSVLWPRFGLPAPDRIVFVAKPQYGGVAWDSHMSLDDFQALQQLQHGFDQIAGSVLADRVVTGGPVATRVFVEGVTGNYFPTLGVRAFLGRTVGATDDDPAAPVVMVLSHHFWRATFASDPGVIGRVVHLNDDGGPVQIVGVAPPDFDGLLKLEPRSQWRTSAWISFPAGHALAGRSPASGGGVRLTAIGRLRPGQRIEPIAAELAVISARIDASRAPAAAPAPAQGGPFRWTTRTINEIRTPYTVRRMSAGIGIVLLVGLLLVVGCTNLANLTLARGSTRMSEIVVRRALGASRGQLVRELLAENLLIAAAGGFAALIAAQWLIRRVADGISISGRTLTELVDPRLNVLVYAFAGVGVTIALAVFGLVPALRLTRAERANPIGRDVGASPQWRGQRGLILAQVTVSTMLFLMASYFIVAVNHVADADAGFDMDRLVTAHLSFLAHPGDQTRTEALIASLQDEAGKDPLVERVSMATSLPGWNASDGQVTPIERPDLLDKTASWVPFSIATPELLQALGVPIQSGRTFDRRDLPGAPLVAVVNETLARSLFGTSRVVGRQVLARRLPQHPVDTLTIVGVAGDTYAEAWGRPDGSLMYVPYAQHIVDGPPSLIVARLRPGADLMAGVMGLRNAIRLAAPDVAIDRASAGETMLAPQRGALRTLSVVATGLGAFALALTLAGLYGVLSHVVTRRSRELGVRMALGAETRQILALVLREGLGPVVGGVALGVILGIPTRVLAGDALSGFWTGEPVLFACVAVSLIVCGAAACYWPARRASRVDPNVVLKEL